jgi:hypothetical protein
LGYGLLWALSLKITEVAQISGYFFHGENYVSISTKRRVGLDFGRFFKSSGHLAFHLHRRKIVDAIHPYTSFASTYSHTKNVLPFFLFFFFFFAFLENQANQNIFV